MPLGALSLSKQRKPKFIYLRNAPPNCQFHECRGFCHTNLSYDIFNGHLKFHIESREEMSRSYAYKKGQILSLNGTQYKVIRHFGPCASAATYLVETIAVDNMQRDSTPTPPSTRFVLKVFDPRTSLHRILTKGSPLACDPDRVTGTVIPWSKQAEQWASRWRSSDVAAEFNDWSDEQLNEEDQKLFWGRAWSPEPGDMDKREWENEIGDGMTKVEGCFQDWSECDFRKELFAYHRLANFQGTVIPKLHQYGEVTIHDSGRSLTPWALLLEHVQGAHPLSDLSQAPDTNLSAKVKLQDSVKSVCEVICKWAIDYGVLHGHLESDHFLLTSDRRLVIVSFTRAAIAGLPPRVYDLTGKLLPLEGPLWPQETDEYTHVTVRHSLGYETEHPPIVWSPSAALYNGTSALFQWLVDTEAPVANWKEGLAYLKARHRSHPKESLALLEKSVDSIHDRENKTTNHVAYWKRRRAIEEVFWNDQLQSEMTRLENWFKAESNAVKNRLRKNQAPVPLPTSPLGRSRLMPVSLPDVALRNVRLYTELRFGRRDTSSVGLTESADPSLPLFSPSTSTSHSTSDSSSSDQADSSVDLEGFQGQRHKAGTEDKEKSRYLMSFDDTPERDGWVHTIWSMRQRSGVWESLCSLACVDLQTLENWLCELPVVENTYDMGEEDPRRGMLVKQWRPYNALLLAVDHCQQIIRDGQEEKRFLDAVLRKKHSKKYRAGLSSSQQSTKPRL